MRCEATYVYDNGLANEPLQLQLVRLGVPCFVGCSLPVSGPDC